MSIRTALYTGAGTMDRADPTDGTSDNAEKGGA